MSVDEFALVQVQFTFGGLICWVFDLGLIGFAFISAAKGNLGEMAACWALRTKFFVIPATGILILFFWGQMSITIAFALIVGMQEFIVDSHLPIRQIVRGSAINFHFVTTRKIAQVLLILVFYVTSGFVSLEQALSAVGLPSFIVLVLDLIFLFRNNYRTEISAIHIKKSMKYFLQNAGTSLATLDVVVISFYGSKDLIYPYVLGKKFYSFLMIPGTVFMQQTIYNEKTTGHSRSKFLQTMKGVNGTTVLCCLISLIVFIFMSDIFLGQHAAIEATQLIGLMILLPVLGVSSTNLNAILISRDSFKLATFATFTSSVIYLIFLTTSLLFGIDPFACLQYALVLNLVIEIFLYDSFIFRVSKSCND